MRRVNTGLTTGPTGPAGAAGPAGPADSASPAGSKSSPLFVKSRGFVFWLTLPSYTDRLVAGRFLHMSLHRDPAYGN